MASARPWYMQVWGLRQPLGRGGKIFFGGLLAFGCLGFTGITWQGLREMRRPLLRPDGTELYEGRLVDFKPFIVKTKDGESFEGYFFTAEPYGGTFFVPGQLIDRSFKTETLTPGTPVSFRVLPEVRKSGKGPVDVCEFRTGQGTLLDLAEVAADQEFSRRVVPCVLGFFWTFLAFCGYTYYRNVRATPS